MRLTGDHSPISVAASLVNTLGMLSAELEGHALGGGMLKLEPSEASRLVLPLPALSAHDGYLEVTDRWLRDGRRESNALPVDDMVLREGLGLPDHAVSLLRDALRALRDWRRQR